MGMTRLADVRSWSVSCQPGHGIAGHNTARNGRCRPGMAFIGYLCGNGQGPRLVQKQADSPALAGCSASSLCLRQLAASLCLTGPGQTGSASSLCSAHLT